MVANKSKDIFSIKIYCIYLYKIKDAWKSNHRCVSCLYSVEINKQNKENTNVWRISEIFFPFFWVLKEPLDTKQKCLKNVYYWHILIPNLPSNRLWNIRINDLALLMYSAVFSQVLSLSPMSPPNGGTSARLPILHPTPLWAKPGDRWVDMGTDRPGAPQPPTAIHPARQSVTGKKALMMEATVSITH